LTTLILVRHGATAFTTSGRYQGHRDEPLSEEGREQARVLGARLLSTWSADVTRARVWTSDLMRARETAWLALGRDGFQTDSRLRELSFGRFEGLTAREIEEREPEVYKVWLGTPEMSGGESLAQLRSRLQHWLDEITNEEAVLAFTHGGAIRMLLSIVTGERFEIIRQVSISPTDAVRLTFRAETATPRTALEWLRAWQGQPEIGP
jgi:broad specificity phosphatase PhoE